MESLERGDADLGEMGSSETSRLVTPNTGAKPSYMNITSNLCTLIILGLITYCCIKTGGLFSFHPTLMTIGWLVVMTSAINAVTPGDLATEWMPMRLRSARHWVLQLVGGSIVLAGFIVIVINKIIHNDNHFVTLHAKFGLASFIFMLIAKSGGLGALYSLKLKQYLAPLYIKLIHASVGLLTFILGIITILLGLFSNWWTRKEFGDILRYIIFSLVLTVMVLTILRPCLKIYFRLKERIENAN